VKSVVLRRRVKTAVCSEVAPCTLADIYSSFKWAAGSSSSENIGIYGNTRCKIRQDNFRHKNTLFKNCDVILLLLCLTATSPVYVVTKSRSVLM